MSHLRENIAATLIDKEDILYYRGITKDSLFVSIFTYI